MSVRGHDLEAGSTLECDERPWVRYVVLSDADDHKAKRITVRPGKRLSFQRHAHRTEYWFVVSGHGVVTLDGAELAVTEGSAVDVPAGAAHRIAICGTKPLVFIEVQQRAISAKTTSSRLDDDFGRAPA